MKLVILDRDGTINVDRADYVKSVDEWIALDGALQAIARLNAAGYTVVIATNQSAIGRGLFDMETLNAMHNKMLSLLRTHGGRVDSIFFCPHTPEDRCGCRKPLSGMFTEIGQRYGVDLTHAHAVGDSLRDLQAGAAAGCHPHLVCTGKSGHGVPAQLPADTVVHKDLAAFADWLIARDHSQTTGVQRG